MDDIPRPHQVPWIGDVAIPADAVSLPATDRVIPDSRRLADLTTFRIGGMADHLIVARSQEELVEAIRQTDQSGSPLLVLSGGSNMLVSDEGFAGTVVLVASQGISLHSRTDTSVNLCVAAGQPWDDLVRLSVEQGWGGLETLSGIPGLMGAAPVQNIGAYGEEVASALTHVTAYDRHTDKILTFPPAAIGFGSRTSLFKQSAGRLVILSVGLHLDGSGLSRPVRYAELARRLGVDIGTRVPVAEVRQAVLELRRGKGMVIDETDHDTWSAGSFFTNPVIGADQAAGLPHEAPRFTQPDGSVKTSAAWLIDHAGFTKGYGSGRATLSTKHVLALTNRGGATAQDIVELARTIRHGVQQTYGITLQAEPVLVGLTL